MKIHFIKMQALGNDFILIDSRKRTLKGIGSLSRNLCSRRFGIGADQLLVLTGSRKADYAMRIFNADGSEVEMCGNGIRCLAKYIWDRGLKKSSTLAIQTPAGIIRPAKAGSLIRVDMGRPILRPKDIPVQISRRTSIIDHPIRVRGSTYRITCVSMGNPHAVIVVRDINSAPVQTAGPFIERHRSFPQRTNVEFIEIGNRRTIRTRVWERGAGETMACGTGASAVAVASHLLGLTGRKVTVHLPGGRLLIEWSPGDDHVYMTGPAEEVFEGSVEI